VYLDGIWLKRSWGGEVKNVAVLVAIGVNQERGLRGVKLFVSDRCLGVVENLAEFYPEASWQRCVVHFYRNVWTLVPKGKVREAAAMLKAIHAQEDREPPRAVTTRRRRQRGPRRRRWWPSCGRCAWRERRTCWDNVR